MRIKLLAVSTCISCQPVFLYKALTLPPTLSQQREYFVAAEKLLSKDKEKDYLHLSKSWLAILCIPICNTNG